jgi:hypothetical protein
MGISGPADATAIEVDAQAHGTTGTVRLTLTVPPGVTLRRASGDWESCEQDGTLISCTATSTTGRWTGIVRTRWADGATGTVAVEVGATYRSGGHVNASAAATWPP